nr:integrase, catalytic region, zinc finger, CCHC-type, peptidase aspartic, catalytic [Tanacetum cinerariifolium]
MTSRQINSGLALSYAPSTITTQKPIERDLDLLFKAMYDDYIGGQPLAATITTPAAQAPQLLQTPIDVDELQQQYQHEQKQDNQALLQAKIVANNVPNAMFEWDTFINPFAPPSTNSAESSSQNVDPSNMHTFYQPYQHEYQWTKDHLCEQVKRSHWQYKFPLPVKVVATARRLEMPLPEVCTAIEEKKKKLPNDREDIGKLGAKGDIGFFIGYSANSCAYGIFNQRTKKIIETMNVSFDELSAMAFEQRNTAPIPKNSSSHATNIPITSQDDDELNSNDMVDGNTFVNPFANSSTSAAESSSSQNVDPSNMRNSPLSLRSPNKKSALIESKAKEINQNLNRTQIPIYNCCSSSRTQLAQESYALSSDIARTSKWYSLVFTVKMKIVLVSTSNSIAVGLSDGVATLFHHILRERLLASFQDLEHEGGDIRIARRHEIQG